MEPVHMSTEIIVPKIIESKETDWIAVVAESEPDK
jgi:hypothetical protein